MAESVHESESSVNDSIVDTVKFASLPSESEFSAVIFHAVQECYLPDRDIECRYTIKTSVKPTTRDWIGMFKVGWQSSREHFTYEWSPIPQIQDGEQGRPLTNRVVFRQKYLPKADDEFYQFCYVNSAGDVRGASVPFQIRIKTIEPELECCEIEDDDFEGTSIMVVKNKTAMLEESLGRALEENSVFKAAKEILETDLSNANERVMELETRKAEIITAMRELERKASMQEEALGKLNNDLEDEQSRGKELEAKVAELQTTIDNLNSMLKSSGRRVDELVNIVEQGRAQTTEVEKNREKLEIEQKQYLARMTADREMIDKLQSDLNTKEDEVNAVKVRLMELRSKAKAESSEYAEKLDMINSANVKFQEQLTLITDENNLLKQNMEQESDHLTKQVREINLVLKNKNEDLAFSKEEISKYKQRCELLESTKEEIDKAAILEREVLGKKLEDLQGELRQKQEVLHRLEYDVEDLKTQLANEKGKNTALEEDYESVIRALEDQLEGEKALNHSLCSQSDRNLADVQSQVQKQLAANAELGRLLEARTADTRSLFEELEITKKQLQASEEKVQKAWAQLTAADTEVRSLKTEKESLQMSLTNVQGTSVKSAKNSAASMYALQTAHSHLEKKYLTVKKELDSLWRERNELKRTVAAFQGSVSSDDLRLQIEELRARNEDLRVRLNMGAEAYKMKFIECRKLEAQMKKLQRTSSTDSIETSVTSDVPTLVSKLHKALDEKNELVAVTTKALALEKSTVIEKNEEINELKQDIFELRQKVEVVGQLELQNAADQSKADTMRKRMISLEDALEIEKREKENVIREIVHLQELLKEKDRQIEEDARSLEVLRETLSQEQADRESLGEEARLKLQKHADSERELHLKVKQLNGEVERWKREVDLHVEAEAVRLMETKPEEQQTATQPLPQQGQPTPAQAQPTHPTRGVHPRPWHNPPSQIVTAGPPQPQPQPWLYVQPPPVQGACPVVTEVPTPGAVALPQPPCVPAGEPSVPQCPVCMALLPPSIDLDDHVNSHFD